MLDASRRMLQIVTRLADAIARVSPLPTQRAAAWLGLEEVPLLGSLITAPAAMTIAALMLALVMSLEDLSLTSPIQSFARL